ncbi:MAG: class I SAM-dependent methyltransferase [Chloroflexota bacterium]|nr:class I SAM-dependent methyltransferase [Chloroflexota bacterium]
MVRGHSIPFDYRQSHVNPGKGSRYDALYSPGSALAFYWDHIERPYLEAQFGKVKQARPDGRYLDFACGTGRILEVGAAYFGDATGIDVSETMSELARAKVPSARIVRVDVLKEPVDVGTFDVITLFRFLLRAGDLRGDVLEWLRAVIRDDGLLIVNNHRNAHSIRGILYRIGHWIHPDPFGSELLTDRQVAAMVRRCGFEVVEEYGFGSVPSYRGSLIVPARVLMALERRLTGSGRTAHFAKNRIYVCRPIVGSASAPAAAPL